MAVRGTTLSKSRVAPNKASKHSDAFICHASEDKEDVARPLAKILSKSGFQIWYDEYSLKLGDNLRRRIAQGLANSRFGVVIISPKFFAKEWPQKELDMLVQLEVRSRKKRILPVWHDIDQKTITKFSLDLANIVAVQTSQGLEIVARKIIEVIGKSKPMNAPSDQSSKENLVDLSFRKQFETKLVELGEAVGSEPTKSKIEDIIDNIIMLFKERIEKWDVPSVGYATRELFLMLYPLTEKGILSEPYRIFKDLFEKAFKERKRLVERMLDSLDIIMFESWIPDNNPVKGEAASRLLLRIGLDFLHKDMEVVKRCATAIDNLAGDEFIPEYLSKEILLAAAAYDLMADNTGLRGFLHDLEEWIRVNDQYAWDDNNYTYLRDSIDYAKTEQEEYGIDLDKFQTDVLYPALLGNIASQVEDFVDSLVELRASDETDLSLGGEQLASLIRSYEFIQPHIARDIMDRALAKHGDVVNATFNSMIQGSNFLKAIYRNFSMITTFEEFIKFLESSSDFGNLGVGLTTGGFAAIDFTRKTTSNDKKAIEDLVRKYGADKDIELDDRTLMFEMDSVVYLRENQYDMSKLIQLLRELNEILEIESFSSDFTFRLRRLRVS